MCAVTDIIEQISQYYSRIIYDVKGTILAHNSVCLAEKVAEDFTNVSVISSTTFQLVFAAVYNDTSHYTRFWNAFKINYEETMNLNAAQYIKLRVRIVASDVFKKEIKNT